MWQPPDVILDDMSRLTGQPRDTITTAITLTYQHLRDQGWSSWVKVEGFTPSIEEISEYDIKYLYEVIYIEMVSDKFSHPIHTEEQRHALKAYASHGFMKGSRSKGVAHLRQMSSNELFIPISDDYEPEVGGQFRVRGKHRSTWYVVVAASDDVLHAVPSLMEHKNSSWEEHISKYYVINDPLVRLTLKKHKRMSEERGEPVWVFDYDIKKRDPRRMDYLVWGP